MGSRNSNAGNASVEEAEPEAKIASVVTKVNCNSKMIRLCLQQLLHMFFSQSFVTSFSILILKMEKIITSFFVKYTLKKLRHIKKMFSLEFSDIIDYADPE